MAVPREMRGPDVSPLIFRTLWGRRGEVKIAEGGLSISLLEGVKSSASGSKHSPFIS